MEKGIILLPEDRQKEGLIMSWGLGRNVTLPTISKYAKSGINDEKTERDLAKNFLKKLIQRQLISSSRQALFPVVTSRKLLLPSVKPGNESCYHG